MAGAVVEAGIAAAGAVATGMAVKEEIIQALGDYDAEIKRMQEMRNARLTQMSGSQARGKAIGVAGLTEAAAAGEYETRTAMMKAEMASSTATARLGASGVKATGSALMGAQQTADIAYAAADRTAEAAASGIRIGGLELGNKLQSAEGEKSLLTLEYRQNIGEQQRKRDELDKNKRKMVNIAMAGGMLNAAGSLYRGVARAT